MSTPDVGLSEARLNELRSRGIAVPAYDRRAVTTGIVHFGPGAFHRVHQAWYFDAALTRDPRWGLCEIALQSTGVRDALAPQDGLYTLAILDEQRRFAVVGAINELLVARESPATVIRRLADPRTKLVTATVTEKGYCLRSDGSLDDAHPDIVHDLQHPHTPRSLIGYLAAGLHERRAKHIAAPTIISCDNLVDNGRRLRRGVLDYCQRFDTDLAAWVQDVVAFPSSMVDSITPATDDDLRALVMGELGVADRWPVQREFFTQWVIEDDFRNDHPDWSSIGVTITDDVKGFERAKLRLLNGAHSTLAYVGSLAGYETVAQAMADPALSQFVTRMMQLDIVPTLNAPRGLDLQQYIDAVLRRFRNPAIRHLLAQIAWDGSQKLPFRLLGTIRDRLQSGNAIERLAVPIAAWMHFIRRKSLRGERATDPLAEDLLAIGAGTSGGTGDVRSFLALEKIFPRDLAQHAGFQRSLERAYDALPDVMSSASLSNALATIEPR
jgi:fructuronate reductase